MVNWRIVALRDRSLFTGVGRATIFKGGSLFFEPHFGIERAIEKKNSLKVGLRVF